MNDKKPLQCPCCNEEIPASVIAAWVGSQSSEAKAEAARSNGKKGGRPKGSQDSKPRKKRSV